MGCGQVRDKFMKILPPSAPLKFPTPQFFSLPSYLVPYFALLVSTLPLPITIFAHLISSLPSPSLPFPPLPLSYLPLPFFPFPYLIFPSQPLSSLLFSSLTTFSFSPQHTSLLTYSIGHVAACLCLRAQYGRLCCLY